MTSSRLDLSVLDRLLRVAAPSGFELPAANVWHEAAAQFTPDVHRDVHGAVMAGLHPEARPRLVFAAHLDEIGLMVTHVDAQGLLYVAHIGYWNAQMLVGQRITIQGRGGPVYGVIGYPPLNSDGKPPRFEDLWVDIGTRSREEALALVRIGDPAVVAVEPIALLNSHLASRALDNRIGAFVLLAILADLANTALNAGIWLVANTREEIYQSGGGITSALYALDPDATIVVDATYATDCPSANERITGSHPMGSGPALGRGSALDSELFEQLAAAAETLNLPYTIEPLPNGTESDADLVPVVRRGVPTGLVSIPLHYMHSPSEVVDLEDVQTTVRLLCEFARRFRPLAR